MLRPEKEEIKDIKKYLEENGWEEVQKKHVKLTVLNEKYEEITTNIKKYIWIDEFKKQFFKINNINDEKIFIRVLEILNNSDEISILEYFKKGISIKNEKTKLIEIYFLFDCDNIENNTFKYFNELQFEDIRPDFTLFINGIPMIIIEAKSKEKVFDEGITQIIRYQEQQPDLFKYVQFAIKYGFEKRYIPTKPKGKQSSMIWKENNKDTIPKIIKKNLILEFIKYFIFFNQDGSKIIARYIQYYATKKIIKRTTDYLEKKSHKNKGLIWHWQGSGKTYTMFFAANYFYDKFKDKNPIVFFLVDRNELEDQMEKVYKNIINSKVKKINTINELKELLERIKKMEKNKCIIEKGLYILMIHKFNNEKLNFNDEINKKEILFLIDEAHRTQQGELKANLKRIFKNAIQFGFTGTPLFKNDKNTFQEFSYNDELYLDLYFIKQSIADGFTLPIRYTRIVESDINSTLTEDQIKNIIIKYLKEENKIVDPEKLEEKINKKIIQKSPDRLKKLVEHIKERLKEDTENYTFKAMVVVCDRETCVEIKKIFDKYFDPDETEIVMSYNYNDTGEIINYKKKLINKYKTSDMNEINNKIKEKFKNEENPKILIVTDMLLTGFDCPKLKVMYLDKFMCGHRLLQAIARTNRPYKIIKKINDKEKIEINKNFGLVVDSVGILKQIKKIMSEYNFLIDRNKEIEKDIVENMFSNIEIEFEKFKKLLENTKEKLRTLRIGNYDLSIDIDKIKLNKINIDEIHKKIETLVIILNTYINKENIPEDVQKAFITLKSMKEVRSLYEALGSYPEKLKYKKDIGIILLILRIYYKSLRRKTSKQIIKEIVDELKDYISVDDFEKLDQIEIDKETKFGKREIKQKTIANLSSLYWQIVKFDKFKHNPLYKQIKEKLNRLIEKWVFEKYEDLELMNEIKELNKNLDEFTKEYGQITDPKEEIRKYLVGKYDINFDKLEKVFNNVIKNKKLLPEDLKKIDEILFEEFLYNDKIDDAEKEAKEILENYIIKRLEEDGIEIKRYNT